MKERGSHHRPRLDYDQQFCRDRFLFLPPDLQTSFLLFILKSSLIKETRTEKSADLGINSVLFLHPPNICMAILANKHTLSVLCITIYARKHKLLLISRQARQNITMETAQTKRMETDNHRTVEYLKLEGTNKDHEVQLPARPAKPKPHDEEHRPDAPRTLTGLVL